MAQLTKNSCHIKWRLLIESSHKIRLWARGSIRELDWMGATWSCHLLYIATSINGTILAVSRDLSLNYFVLCYDKGVLSHRLMAVGFWLYLLWLVKFCCRWGWVQRDWEPMQWVENVFPNNTFQHKRLKVIIF